MKPVFSFQISDRANRLLKEYPDCPIAKLIRCLRAIAMVDLVARLSSQYEAVDNQFAAKLLRAEAEQHKKDLDFVGILTDEHANQFMAEFEEICDRWRTKEVVLQAQNAARYRAMRTAFIKTAGEIKAS